MSTPVWAKDGSPSSIAAAFRQQAAQTRHGSLGPMGDMSPIYIPLAAPRALGHAIAAATAPPRPKAMQPPRAIQSAPGRSRPYTPPVLQVDPVLQRIRAHRYGIAGYACRFDRISHREDGPEIVKRGAFLEAIAARRLCLRANHDVDAPPIASVAANSMHVSEDGLGLWFEAELPDTQAGASIYAQLISAGSLPTSLGSVCSTVHRAGSTRVLSTIVADEISLLMPPRRPGRRGTWARPNKEAQRLRLLLCADPNLC